MHEEKKRPEENEEGSMVARWILRSYVFGPSGLKDYGSATLRCKI